jgi:peptidoglycan/xylan/chitin deacetylase (PgdA/CDA1 family)
MIARRNISVAPEERIARRRAQLRRRRWTAAGIIAAACIGATAVVVSRPGPPRALTPRPHSLQTAASPSRRSAPHRASARPVALVPLHLPDVLPQRSVRLPILMYHRIDRQTSRLSALTRTLTVTPAAFAAQMDWLVRHGFHAVREQQLFAALFKGARLPSKPVLLTFDDGYRDVYTYALPVLARLHLPATAYVITSRISGPDPSFLTWGELRSAQRQGLEIGSHTVTHRPLPALSPTVVVRELVASRRTLERHLGHSVQWFAYPYGSFSAASAAAVRSAGYVLAVTTQGGMQQDARLPMELHRYEIRGDQGLADLAALLSSP